MAETPVVTSELADAETTDSATLTAEELFLQGIDRYQAGEDPAVLIPLFKSVCDRAPKSSPPWTCLAWLYLLTDQAGLAFKAAKKAVKLNPQDAQARVNLAVAMIEDGQKGVREQVEIASQLVLIDQDAAEEVQKNLEEAIAQKPNSKGFQRIKAWIFDS
ncbi:MAG: hypothetical protein VKL01_01485 [Limnothrix sp.]|uniref:hypothetical protein n=1 Tax=unclassified Limnothrix TaxID=2632864 RepID=UPI00081EAD2B|nr:MULTISPECIES: hypothetical protein [unclassified Limnothrix]MEB3117010.1 hypothetical protein [Limnothrix sp.]OCQ97560.1 hypothetical protein BCR12_04800 [Limnothrix sp. P13C2]MBD2551765.1 hypothetical protein [Limnothrix sp. FACHB-708]MBD2591270.1 hypothetical protein [Limnothrix sp. FACHB-406]MBD2634417.1 hypothetical protein [Limnothrix sp. FACHB-881]